MGRDGSRRHLGLPVRPCGHGGGRDAVPAWTPPPALAVDGVVPGRDHADLHDDDGPGQRGRPGRRFRGRDHPARRHGGFRRLYYWTDRPGNSATTARAGRDRWDTGGAYRGERGTAVYGLRVARAASAPVSAAPVACYPQACAGPASRRRANRGHGRPGFHGGISSAGGDHAAPITRMGRTARANAGRPHDDTDDERHGVDDGQQRVPRIGPPGRRAGAGCARASSRRRRRRDAGYRPQAQSTAAYRARRVRRIHIRRAPVDERARPAIVVYLRTPVGAA